MVYAINNKQHNANVLRVNNMSTITEIFGNTAVSITGMKNGSDEITIKFDNGKHVKFYHEQDCCEEVKVEDVCGDVEDLIGSPFLVARQAISKSETEQETSTATFYEFATIKGSVTVRWVGTSNGNYSESVKMDH